jgi:hypothetical protein
VYKYWSRRAISICHITNTPGINQKMEEQVTVLVLPYIIIHFTFGAQQENAKENIWCKYKYRTVIYAGVHSRRIFKHHCSKNMVLSKTLTLLPTVFHRKKKVLYSSTGRNSSTKSSFQIKCFVLEILFNDPCINKFLITSGIIYILAKSYLISFYVL